MMSETPKPGDVVFFRQNTESRYIVSKYIVSMMGWSGL
jgi:hypothetical protein